MSRSLTPIRRDTRIGTSLFCSVSTFCWIARSLTVMRVRSRTYSDHEVAETVESVLGESGGRLRRSVVVKTRTTLVQAALAHLPPRQDPDALIVPDHL